MIAVDSDPTSDLDVTTDVVSDDVLVALDLLPSGAWELVLLVVRSRSGGGGDFEVVFSVEDFVFVSLLIGNLCCSSSPLTFPSGGFIRS